MDEIIVVVVSVIAIAGIISIVQGVNYESCKQESFMLKLKTEYGFWEGCVVTLKDGQKLNQDQFDNYYRINEVQQH